MIRDCVGAMLLASCAAASVRRGVDHGEDVRSLPMSFEWRREGPAEACGTKCRTWISAVGTITADTPRTIREFCPRHATCAAPCWCSTRAAARCSGTLELGRMHPPARHGDHGRQDHAAADREGRRAARDAFAQGRLRIDVRLPAAGRDAPLCAGGSQACWCTRSGSATGATMRPPATYSAEDIMVIQRDIGRLVQYTAEMGGGADLDRDGAAHPAVGAAAAALLRGTDARQARRPRDSLFEPRAGPSRRHASSALDDRATPSVAATTERGWSLVENGRAARCWCAGIRSPSTARRSAAST